MRYARLVIYLFPRNARHVVMQLPLPVARIHGKGR